MRRGVIQEQNNLHQQQMGCMATFLHIFNRHHTLTGKRLSPSSSSSSQPPPPNTPPQSPHSSEIPSQQQHRPSIGVVARLMGLDDLTIHSQPNSDHSHSLPLPLPLHHYRFFDTNNNFRFKIKATDAAKKKSCFYDSGGGEIEKRLKRIGIDEPYYYNDDLHALKQILEALHLKGLLHSNNYKSTLPIVVMKPNKIPPNVSHSPQPPSSFGSSPSSRRVRVRAEPEAISTKLQEKKRTRTKEANRCPNRIRNVPAAQVNSLKVKMRTNVPEQQVTSRSKREDESTTVSDSSLTTINSERYKKEGMNVVERCDKLLNSIAEMRVTTTKQQQQQQSTSTVVSVFDSSPLIKHHKGESEDEALCYNGVVESEDIDDFVYVCQIVRACSDFPHDTQQFLKGKGKGNNTSKTSMLTRHLIFDTVQEILNKKKRLPAWKAVPIVENKIWLELKRMGKREEEKCSSEDVIGWILKKDMTEEMMNEGSVEMGDLILDIERLVFKDLIGEIITNLGMYREGINQF